MSVAKVLVPIGFSNYSDLLLDYAADLCKRINGELHVIHGLEIQNSLKDLCKNNQLNDFIEILKSKLIDIEAKVKKDHNLHVVSNVIEGPVYESVLNYIDDQKINWLVIGANGSAAKKDFIGANTLRILREAQCPSISLKGDCVKTSFNNIVIPLDLTNEVNELLRRISSIAKSFPEVTLRFVSVTTSNDEFVINRMTRHMGYLKQTIIDDGFKASSEIITGVKSKAEIPDTIIDYVRKVKGDLVMIMTQKEVDPVKYFIGSVAQQLINQDEYPVVTIVP